MYLLYIRDICYTYYIVIYVSLCKCVDQQGN